MIQTRRPQHRIGQERICGSAEEGNAMGGMDLSVIEIVRPGYSAQRAPASAHPRRRDPAPRLPASRRRFTAAYKLQVLRRAEAAIAEGKGNLVRLLRHEGLRSSHLAQWRKQKERGLLRDSRRGRPPMDRAALLKENHRLRRKLAFFEECLQESERRVWPEGKRGQPALYGLTVKKRMQDLADRALAGRE
jgi:hypothetical protein